MKSVLITGANSYVGNAVREYLEKWPERFQIKSIRMRDGSWREEDFSPFDVVFCVVGIAHVDRGKISPEREKLYYDVNTKLVLEVARKAKASGVRQFIFMSSAIIYGSNAKAGKGKKITRETLPSPSNCYGESKLRAENGLRQLENNEFKVAIIRVPMIYGRGCKGNFPLLSKLAQKTPIFPRIKNTRSMLYIENLAEFIRLLAENEESGIFWPQNAEYCNTGELVKMIGEAHGKHIFLIKGFDWLFGLAGRWIYVIRSAFGDLYYAKEISVYKQNYQIFSLQESIKRTESSYENDLDH